MLDKILTDFAKALREAIVTDVGNGMSMLSLGPDANFPDDDGRSRCGFAISNKSPF
jgi:hypothetical protein